MLANPRQSNYNHYFEVSVNDRIVRCIDQEDIVPQNQSSEKVASKRKHGEDSKEEEEEAQDAPTDNQETMSPRKRRKSDANKPFIDVAPLNTQDVDMYKAESNDEEKTDQPNQEDIVELFGANPSSSSSSVSMELDEAHVKESKDIDLDKLVAYLNSIEKSKEKEKVKPMA